VVASLNAIANGMEKSREKAYVSSLARNWHKAVARLGYTLFKLNSGPMPDARTQVTAISYSLCKCN